MATSSDDKYTEARDILTEFGVELERIDVEKIEVQADDPVEIVVYSLRQMEDDGRAVVMEDAGIFIEHLGGFPGPYSSYVLGRLGNPGILKLMEDVEDRSAHYQSAVAIRSGNEISSFRGYVRGTIASSVKGTGGFGYDPIFIPDEGDGRTFGEMTEEEKNVISHRARAFRKLGEWLASSP
ncbi:RdgB/HAM1 family non-canonical purine NTP pyrophosphatase [Candidatus Bathyarchaeota archaeon]|nr:RdgB/HAM1 family non-canonical purine NTP pyrophosphatase [Candidatus Bathyarchaeota archaeon]